MLSLNVLLAKIGALQECTCRRSANTAEQYRYHFVRHIEKGVGRLRIREASVARLDRLVATVKELHGPSAPKTTRTVLSGMFGLAVRYDAFDRNPVREVGRIESERNPRGR